MASPRIPSAYIAERLGELTASMEQSRLDRAEFKTQIEALRQAINGLQQSNISTNTILADLASQKLSVRLMDCEQKLDNLQRAVLTPTQVKQFVEMHASYISLKSMIGGTRSFIFKCIIAMLASSVVMGAIVSLVEQHLPH